eukprot:9479926-Pyramimonas_sp.AAC.1
MGETIEIRRVCDGPTVIRKAEWIYDHNKEKAKRPIAPLWQIRDDQRTLLETCPNQHRSDTTSPPESDANRPPGIAPQHQMSDHQYQQLYGPSGNFQQQPSQKVKSIQRGRQQISN